MARERREQGDEGWAHHLTAEIAARRGDRASAAAAYRQALGIAEALEMRPLAARCHLGLGVLAGNAFDVRTHLTQATELFAALGLARWREEAEARAAEIAR